MVIKERDHPGEIKKQQELAFTVQTIDCITCTPVFRRYLNRIKGVIELKELPITNKIIVVFDGNQLNSDDLKREIILISKRAGFGDKLIFH